MMVYCVMCIDDDGGCCVHIFSTQENASTFAESDSRPHVLYDYVADRTLYIEDLNPEVAVKWRVSRGRMFKLGWRCIVASIRR